MVLVFEKLRAVRGVSCSSPSLLRVVRPGSLKPTVLPWLLCQDFFSTAISFFNVVDTSVGASSVVPPHCGSAVPFDLTVIAQSA